MNVAELIDMLQQVADRGDGDLLVMVKDKETSLMFIPDGVTVEPIATDGDGHVVSCSGTAWIDVTEY